jgi:hypothetical protein
MERKRLESTPMPLVDLETTHQGAIPACCGALPPLLETQVKVQTLINNIRMPSVHFSPLSVSIQTSSWTAFRPLILSASAPIRVPQRAQHSLRTANHRINSPSA